MAENSSPPGPPDSPERAADIAPIEQAIRCRLGHRVRDLRLWIEPHGLVIDGGASSYYDKQMAQHLVRELSGLDVADNRIVVDSLLEPTVGDDIGRFQRHWFYRDIVTGRHRSRYRHTIVR
ncbi:MAG TPA: hypothetical protein VMR25_16925 [Planctomycetaceae bacterium]|jgi:hypothetical protein|nr:hypothetical protein [Planctomycetaceae bacterium]